MKRLLREPLLHFAVLGILLFGWFRVTAGPAPEAESDTIRLSDATLTQMVAQYRSVWKRPPTEEQLAKLAENALREEVMVREALALGLDRGDAVIRNRLRQKMQFLTDSAAQAMDPDDEILRTHLEENAERFVTPATASFEQVFLGQTPGEQDVEAALQSLRGGGDPARLGQGALLPPQVSDATPQQVDSLFGEGFFAALEKLTPGEWQGPVRSGYGVHLVRVTRLEPPSLPDLAALRDKVLFDWRSAQAQALSDAQYEALRRRYEIIAPEPADLQKALAQ